MKILIFTDDGRLADVATLDNQNYSGEHGNYLAEEELEYLVDSIRAIARKEKC